MSKRGWVIAGLGVLAIAAGAYATREHWSPQRAAAQSQARPPARALPVETAQAQRKQVPVRIEALGTVTVLASVAVKSRLETEILTVHFNDGARVAKGDLLFTLDSRSLEAQIAQAEGTLARDKAQLEGAERDVRRYTELLAKNAGTALNVENAKTQADMLRGTIRSDQALLANLRVQLSYTKILAPIPGRISAAAVKAGNFVRPADLVPLATINQIKPIYLAFSVPQQALPDVRIAMDEGAPRVEAVIPGDRRTASGRLAMIDNTVDAATGMVTIRAIMDNEDEALWPGTLVNARLILREETAVVLPSAAVQIGQNGTYVFIVKDDKTVELRPVVVGRTVDTETVLRSGLNGGETVVTDGHMSLSNGARVAPKQTKSGPTS